MKKSILKTALSFSALVLTLCISCKEKEDTELPLEDKNGAVLKMNVNDSPWSAKWAYTITTPLDEEEGDYFVVFITGATGDYTSNEGQTDGEALSFYIAIPKSKFNNPVGTYKLAGMDYMEEENPAAAIFNRINGNETVAYISSAVDGKGKAVGTISIESFKVGQQKFMGQDLGQGYTELSGSFTINEMIGFSSGSEMPLEGTLKLTNGKFEVKNGWSNGFMNMASAIPQVTLK